MSDYSTYLRYKLFSDLQANLADAIASASTMEASITSLNTMLTQNTTEAPYEFSVIIATVNSMIQSMQNIQDTDAQLTSAWVAEILP